MTTQEPFEDIGNTFRQQRSPFAPKTPGIRRRIQIATPQEPPKQEILDPPPPPVPATDDIADSATRFHVMVGNLQHERNEAVAKVATLEARIEQFQARVTELISQLETARLETADANRRTDDVRNEIAFLKAAIHNAGTALSDALNPPERIEG